MSKKIYIDAGHGGVQPGACKGSRKESDDVLRMALKVRDYLKGQDCEVKLSRTTDIDVDIDDRCADANKWGADYFLSIHRNSASASATGNEIWVYSKASTTTVEKARIILDAVCQADGLRKRGVYKGAASYSDYGVNKYTNMHSALLELGFISNANDNKVYDAKLDAVALAIAKALLSVVGGSWQNTTVKEETVETPPVASSSSTLKAGTKLNLKNAPIFSSATIKNNSGKRSGTYYVWSDEVVNNRIRITNTPENVGKTGQVTGFIFLTVAQSMIAELKFKVIADNLNIRKGASTLFSITGKITDHGIYTIVETKGTIGKAGSWGKLKSGAGWISLNSCYVKQM